MQEILALAIEALSWIELKKLSFSLALSNAIKQLGIANKKNIANARSLIIS